MARRWDRLHVLVSWSRGEGSTLIVDIVTFMSQLAISTLIYICNSTRGFFDGLIIVLITLANERALCLSQEPPPASEDSPKGHKQIVFTKVLTFSNTCSTIALKGNRWFFIWTFEWSFSALRQWGTPVFSKMDDFLENFRGGWGVISARKKCCNCFALE